MKKWFEIKNKADKAEIWIYEEIGEDWWTGEGVTAKSFQKELSAIKASQIDLHINSPGGQAFEGITIYNLLKQHSAKVTTYIDGLAGSIASVIALSGDKVFMAENALFMMHEPSGYAFGNSEEMRKTADLLDKVGRSISLAYQDKSGKDEKEIKDLMVDVSWLSAQEAKGLGFVDEITGAADMTACAKFVPIMEKAKFKNIPKNFLNIVNQTKTPTIRETEQVLRDAGFSSVRAKAILAEGFKDEQRDVVPPEPDTHSQDQRDVDPPDKKKDRVADLLARASVVASI